MRLFVFFALLLSCQVVFSVGVRDVAGFGVMYPLNESKCSVLDKILHAYTPEMFKTTLVLPVVVTGLGLQNQEGKMLMEVAKGLEKEVYIKDTNFNSHQDKQLLWNARYIKAKSLIDVYMYGCEFE
jgi:hypothetical protein